MLNCRISITDLLYIRCSRIGSTLLYISISVFFIFTLASHSAHAVGGISNSKVIVPSTDTVPYKRFEFEPFFVFNIVDDNDNSKLFGGGVRITYGLLENTEFGVSVNYLSFEDSDIIQSSTDFGDIQAGLKLRLFDQSDNIPFSLAYQAGISIPVSDNIPWLIEPGGLILTTNITERFSMDVDAVFGILEDNAWTFISEVGFGFYITDWLQPVVEAAYGYEDPEDEENIKIVKITGGFTANATDWMTIILGVTKDVYTRGTDDELIFTAAFTFSF